MRRLMAFGPQLAQACAAVAELDCLLSLASCAREFRLIRPTLTADNVLHIKKGATVSSASPSPHLTPTTRAAHQERCVEELRPTQPPLTSGNACRISRKMRSVSV